MLYTRIRANQKALILRDGELSAVLGKGRYWFNPFADVSVTVYDVRQPQIFHPDLELMIKSGLLEEAAETLQLNDSQRALLWIDGRFNQVLMPGCYAFWKAPHTVKFQIVDATKPRFSHPDLMTIVNAPGGAVALETIQIAEGQIGLYFKDGTFVEKLKPGFYAFWRGLAKTRFYVEDIREKSMDISGQDIMTADKVTLRVNAVLAYRVVDVLKSVLASEKADQALYREAQLALRAAVGTRDLDALLTDKETLAGELMDAVRSKADALGLEIVSLGIRDIILPGDMKTLLNQVTEVRKAAEANLIARREETAAVRSQANTAKMIEANPTLMRLRELEALEKVAAQSKLNIVLGEKGLTDQIINMV